MCIYYKNKESLTYTGQEHIFPASIGGIEKLPIGFVSDQVNNYFSKLEQVLLKSSFLSFSRGIFGPGKRGTDKLGEINACIVKDENGEFCLGYIFKGKPYYIPQLVMNLETGLAKLHIDKKDGEDYLPTFIEALENYNGKFIYIYKNNIPKNEILIGHYQKKYFVASAFPKLELAKIEGIIKLYLEHSTQKNEYKKTSSQVTIENDAIISKDNAKIYAKIAFNVLAKFKGKNYLLNPAFDEIREWIIGEKDIETNWIPTRNSNCNFIVSEFTGHYCVISNIDGNICAEVSLYGWKLGIKLGETFDDGFDIPIGFFCDSENKKEFTLLEKLREYANN